MARNGTGTYSRVAGTPYVYNTVIDQDVVNDEMDDIATALTASIAKDGQTTPTADLPMGTYKHTGVGAATARTQYARAAEVQDGSITHLTSVSGTDTITATAALSMSAYATGQKFSFVAAGANTGATTININSIGAKSITKAGATALAAGDIANGAAVEIIYDGTQFQLIASSNSLSGKLVDIAALAVTDGNIIVGNGTTWVAESGATARTSLGLAIGTDVQAYDATLTAFAGGLTAANKIPYATALNTLGELDFKDEDAMTSNSATAVPSQQSVKAYVDTSVAAVSAGAWELVSTTSVTATASITFDLQEDVYCQWVFVGDGVIPATDDADLIFRMGYTGGTLFETTAYTATTAGRVTTPPTDNTIAGSSDVNQGVGTAAGEHANFVLTISGVSSSVACGFAWRFESSWKDTGNAPRCLIGSGYYSGNTERLWDAIRFLWSSGNFEAAGTIKMFGLKQAG